MSVIYLNWAMGVVVGYATGVDVGVAAGGEDLGEATGASDFGTVEGAWATVVAGVFDDAAVGDCPSMPVTTMQMIARENAIAIANEIFIRIKGIKRKKLNIYHESKT